MPYIIPAIRQRLIKITDAILEIKTLEVGDITYLFYYIAKHYIHVNGRRYTNFAAVIGALICAALEFYRRVITRYEDGKRAANGDVYEDRP